MSPPPSSPLPNLLVYTHIITAVDLLLVLHDKTSLFVLKHAPCQPCKLTLCNPDSSFQEAICSASTLDTSSISHPGVLPCMCRLVTMWAPPEYACTFLNGGSDYQLDPAVEVFAFGIVLGQLLDCGLWPTGMTEDEYLQLLANGQYQLPVSVHSPSMCAILKLKCPLFLSNCMC